MADFTQIIQEINDDITANGVGAIKGAKLNEVLRDMIAAVNAEKQDPLTIDATPTEDSTNPVQSGGVYEALNTLIPRASLFGGFITDAATPNPEDSRRYFLTLLDGELPNFEIYNLPDNGKWKFIHWNPRDAAWDWETIDSYTSAQIDQLLSAVAAAISGKQDTISDLAAIRSGASAGATAYQKPSGGIPKTDLASGVQTSLGKADTAVQPSALATVATSGSYNDLLNKPTIPAAQVNSDWNANSGVAQILNKPTIPDVSGKADKVGGATNGDFAGLDANGNLTDSGKKASDFATPIPVVDASTIPASMDADKVYQYGTLSGDTTFPALNTPTDLTVAHVYCWTFTTPATAPTITWPSAITSWAGGSAPTINASKSYEVSVMDGFATIIEN